MKKVACTVVFVMMLFSVGLAQNPPASIKEEAVVVAHQPGTPFAAKKVARSNTSLPFCPPQSCLYYAGDFDPNNNSANGLDNVNSAVYGKTQVWVGVKPTHDATVTGATFNECASINEGIGVNPTPFAIQVGIKPGQAGRTVCRTNGNATFSLYQQNDLCSFQASYTIAKLAKACTLKKGKVYYVNLLPSYTDSNVAALTDVEDKPARNHYGWKNVLDDSYFNSVAYGYVYDPTWGAGGACQGFGCDAFSIALTGTQKK